MFPCNAFPSPRAQRAWWGGIKGGGLLTSPHPGSSLARFRRPSPPLRGGREYETVLATHFAPELCLIQFPHTKPRDGGVSDRRHQFINRAHAKEMLSFGVREASGAAASSGIAASLIGAPPRPLLVRTNRNATTAAFGPRSPAGAARLSAFHRGSCQGTPHPRAQLQCQLRGRRATRRVAPPAPHPLPAMHLARRS